MGGQVKKNARTKNGKGGIQVSSKSSRTQQQKEMLNREDAVSRRLKKKGESDQSRRKKKKKTGVDLFVSCPGKKCRSGRTVEEAARAEGE